MKYRYKIGIAIVLVAYILYKVVYLLGLFTTIKYDIEETTIDTHSLEFVYKIANQMIVDLGMVVVLIIGLLVLLFKKKKHPKTS